MVWIDLRQAFAEQAYSIELPCSPLAFLCQFALFNLVQTVPEIVRLVRSGHLESEEAHSPSESARTSR